MTTGRINQVTTIALPSGGTQVQLSDLKDHAPKSCVASLLAATHQAKVKPIWESP